MSRRRLNTNTDMLIQRLNASRGRWEIPETRRTIDIEIILNLFLGAASAHEACNIEDLDCPNYSDQIGLEAIRSLHRQLDDDDNGDIDLSESDDVCLAL